MVEARVEKYVRNLMANRGRIQDSAGIKLAGYLFLLEKMEQDKAHRVYSEKCSMNYFGLHYGDDIDRDFLVAYAREIEQHYGFQSGIVSEELRIVLGDVDKEVVQNIIRLVHLMNDTVASIADVYSTFLQMSVGVAGMTSGLCPTMPSVLRLQSELIQLKPGMSVYDPFCGMGSIVEAVNKDINLYLQDVDMTVTPLAAINTFLHGISLEHIRSRDSYLYPQQDIKFDVVTCFPPMNMKMSPNYVDEIYKNNHLDPKITGSDTVASLIALDNIKDDGTAVIQMPVNFLFKSGKTELFREWCVENGYVDCVVELPSGAVPNTMVKTAFVILKKKKTDDRVLLIDAESLWTKKMDAYGHGYFSDEAVNRIADVFNRRQESEISSLLNRETILKNESKLTRQSYMVLKDIIFDLPQIDLLRKREEIANGRYEEVTKKLDKLRKEEVE